MSTIIKAHELLNDNQFYLEAQKKTQICVHHTAGGDAKSSISWWNEKPDHISTPYLIERDGTILEVFDPKYWAYALGLTNGTAIEKKTIHIELCNWGGLSMVGGKFYRGVGKSMKEIPASKVVTYKNAHRGFKYFEKYTDAQIKSLIFLIDDLVKRFSIKISDVEKFWYFGAQTKGLISHTTVRKDKSDIHPQPELIKAIYDYFNCKAPVTE